MEKYIIAVNAKEGKEVYLGEYNFWPMLVSEQENAFEFSTAENAKKWYEKTKSSIKNDLEKYCNTNTLCIKKIVVRTDCFIEEFIPYKGE